MNKSESIASLSKALVLAQSKFPQVNFNSVNPYYNSNYADLGAVIETAKPIMAEFGLAVSQLVEGENSHVGITTMLLHESGEYISSFVTIPIEGKNIAQESGKAITYLRRYALSSILGLFSDGDNDGNENQKQPKQTEKKPSAVPQAERPYSPKTLVERLKVMADSFAGKTCTDKDRTSVRINLTTMAGGQPHYHVLLMYLADESHIDDVSDTMILALKKWIHSTKQADETWVPDAFSITEAKAAYLEAVNQQSPLL